MTLRITLCALLSCFFSANKIKGAIESSDESGNNWEVIKHDSLLYEVKNAVCEQSSDEWEVINQEFSRNEVKNKVSDNPHSHDDQSSLRRRGFSEKKNSPSLDAQKQAKNEDIRNQLINKVAGMYALDAHKLNLYGIKELQERDYSSHGDDENESCVSFYVCKYLYLLVNSHFKKTEYDKAQALWNTAKEILANNEKDKGFSVLDKHKEKVNCILNDYNENKKEALVLRVLTSYGLKGYKEKILAMQDIKTRHVEDYDDEKNETFVSFYACKYCLCLTLDFYEKGLYEDARKTYTKASEIFDKNARRDESFTRLEKFLKLPRKVARVLFKSEKISTSWLVSSLNAILYLKGCIFAVSLAAVTYVAFRDLGLSEPG